MKTRNPILSVIIPCYNEKDIIATTLETICCYLNEKYPKVDYEILPINDGSNDNTAVIICEASNKFPQIIILNINYMYQVDLSKHSSFSTSLDNLQEHIHLTQLEDLQGPNLPRMY